MNQSLKGLCSEFYKRACYGLALLPNIPNKKIMTELAPQGWKIAPYVATDQDIAAFTTAAGHGGLFLPSHTIVNKYGHDVFHGPQDQLDRLRRDIRQAAAKVYGITD